MARNLTTGLQRGLRRSIAGGLGASDLFSVASLDLRFAQTKTLDPRITFTRASSGTYVGSDGLIKTATTNLLLRSEQMNLGGWSPSGATIPISSLPSPSGNLTANDLVEDGSTGLHLTQQFVTFLNSATYTVSVYVKAAARSVIQVLLPGAAFSASQGGFFVLSGNGSLGQVNGSPTSRTITNVGGGWYRITVTATSTAAAGGNVAIVSASADGTTSYAGVNGNTALTLWGAQLEQSSTVGEYIPTTSTINSAPRFDHNPTTGESLGLLVEEQRTNSIRNNTMVGAVAGTPGTNPTNWPFVTTSGNGLSQSVVGTGTENGITYIDYRFFGTTVAGSSAIAFGLESTAAATSGQTWTYSLYSRLVSGTTAGISSIQLGIIENNSGGGFVGGSFYTISTPTNAGLITQRSSATRTLVAATTAFCAPTININVTGSTAIDFTIRIGLPQLEQGAFATSAIPTTGTAATRSADVASITGANFSSWYNQTEGTVFAEAMKTNFGSTYYPWICSARVTNQQNAVGLYVGNALGDNSLVCRVSNVDQAVDTYSSTSANRFTNNVSSKICGAYKVDNFAMSTNGQGARNDTLGQVPSGLNELLIGNGDGIWNGTIRRLTYWPSRLPNATLQSITT